MNPRNGMVGAVQPFLSWQGVREDIYVEPIPGVPKERRLSRHQLRRMAKHLERRGLIKIWSMATERQLIFELLLAPREFFVQNQAAPQAAHSVHRGNAHQAAPQAAQHLKPVVLSIGKLNSTPAREAVAVDNSELVFPAEIDPIENRALCALLSNGKLNGRRQLFLDELQGAYDGKTVFRRGAVAYVQSLMEADRRGTFKPSIRGMNAGNRRAKSGDAQRNNAAAQKPEPRNGKGGADALKILKGQRR